MTLENDKEKRLFPCWLLCVDFDFPKPKVQTRVEARAGPLTKECDDFSTIRAIAPNPSTGLPCNPSLTL